MIPDSRQRKNESPNNSIEATESAILHVMTKHLPDNLYLLCPNSAANICKASQRPRKNNKIKKMCNNDIETDAE